MPYCSNCGSETAASDNFCPYCGSAFTNQTVHPVYDSAPTKSIEIASDGSYRTESQNFIAPATMDTAVAQPKLLLEGDRKNPFLALFFTIILPGFTYMYLGEIQKGFLLTVLVFFGYMIIIGFLVHIILVITSYGAVLHYNEERGC